MTVRIAPASRSTKVAWPAPRDSASMPAGAAARRTGRGSGRPGRSGSRIAKSVCLTRSPSGPRPGPGASSRMLRALPAMTRPGVSHASPRGGHEPRRRVRGHEVAEPARLAAPRRAARGPAGRRVQRAGRVEQRLGVLARARTASAWWSRRVSDATRSPGRPLWAKPEHVALAAQLEVALGELEPVAQLGDALSRAPAVSSVGVGDEHAERLDRPAPDPAAQLVELGEPEPVGALDDHHRRLGHVDADLDDGRPDQHVERRRRGSGAISASRSTGFIRPWTSPTRSGARQLGQPDRLGLGGDRARAHRRRRRRRCPPR